MFARWRGPIPLLLASFLLALPAAAQPTDADKLAARNLYFEGTRLQEQSKYLEALDRFSRAQKIFSAPTHLLRIAECQEKLGKLIESAEAYRALANAELAPNAPPVFVQAKEQGAKELPAVEKRIPNLKIEVSPANVNAAKLLVDGEAVSTAFIGGQRPVNPGSHTVAVEAQGYTRAETRVDLKEGEAKTAFLTLQPDGTPIAPAVAPVPGGTAPQASPPPADKPAETTAPPPLPHRSSFGLLLGPRFGVTTPTGTFADQASVRLLGGNQKIGDWISTGGSLGFEAGLRFARSFVVNFIFDHAFLGVTTRAGDFARQGVTVNSAARSTYYGALLGLTSNPDGIGFYGELGFGRRSLTYDGDAENTKFSATFSGLEGQIGLGVWTALGPLRVIPKVSYTGGNFTEYACSGVLCETGSNSGKITGSSGHGIVFFGITGLYHFDLDKKRAAPTPALGPPPPK